MGVGTECYSCGKNFPYSQLKRCSRCLLVRYCSRECQKKGWVKGHNKTCNPNPRCEKQNVKKYSDEWMDIEADKALSRWLDLWRTVLCHIALLSLDLANRPADYNATHMMILWVSPRLFADNPAHNYMINRGEVWPLDRCNAVWPEVGFVPAKNIEPDRLRLVVIADKNRGGIRGVRTLTWQTESVLDFRKMPKEDSKLFASMWYEVLQDMIEEGDVAAAKKDMNLKTC